MSAVLTASMFGPALVPPYDEYLAKAFIRQGGYGLEEFDVWHQFLDSTSTILDIGANFGSHTLHFATVAHEGHVLAFEPQIQLYWMLCGTLALQNRNHVRPYHVAVGNNIGIINVPALDFRAPNNFGGVSLGQYDKGEKVQVVTIDSFGLTACDFIKIDVEGMELSVLEGASDTISKFRPVMSVEADRADQAPLVLEWLIGNDYKVWWHRPPLGACHPGIGSINYLAVPIEKPDPLNLAYCESV